MQKIDSWFIYSFEYFNNVPKLRMTLRTDKNSFGLSPANLDYFEFHIDDKELAYKLYSFRKQFFNVSKLATYMIENNHITVCQYNAIVLSIKERLTKGRAKQLEQINKPEVLAKIRASNKRTAKLRGRIVASIWSSKEGREKYITAINDKEVIKRRIKSFKLTIAKNYEKYIQAMRMPSRKLKIAAAAVAMWKRKSRDEKQRMRPLPGRRTHIVNNIKMNLPESLIANWLTDNQILWKYENPFVDNCGNTYYPDFFIADKGVIIQHYGDFWHANPIKYKAEDELFKGVTVAQKWALDQEYERILREDFGFKVIIIWENELFNNTNTVFENLTKELLC